MKKLSISFITILILFLGCKKEEAEPTASLIYPILTGFEYRNEAADKYYVLGEPNIKLNDSKETDPNDFNYSFITYPNPNVTFWDPTFINDTPISIYFFSRSADSAVFWIEKGIYNELPQDVSMHIGAQTIIANPRLAQFTFYALEGYNQFSLNVSGLAPGYYRAYIKINGVLLWDNLIINQNLTK